MIYGIGCDIAKVSRFSRWVSEPALISRFFHEAERWQGRPGIQQELEHYAARFAAKEAFAKALGTGFSQWSLQDVWVAKERGGRPFFSFAPPVAALLEARAGKGARVHLSLSHEKDFAIAYVVIESADTEVLHGNSF